MLRFLLLLAPAVLGAQTFTFADTQKVLQGRCQKCHSGTAAVGGFNMAQFPTEKSVVDRAKLWARVANRVREGDMPPPGSPALTMAERERVSGWITTTLHTAACADGITPPSFPLRRLNRSEYTATVRDLLNIPVNAGRNLPADGAGGEGFDNAAETLFLSPIHAEKYLEAAKIAIDYAMKDPKSRGAFLTPKPDARATLEALLPRAFRRPALPGEVDRYIALFQAAEKRGDSYDDAISYAIQGLLLSPHFLFRLESSTHDYALASRLSYFLWGAMPDAELFKLAAEGKLSDPEVLSAQAIRLLKDQKSREFAENFVGQWLSIRELGRDIKPDPKVSPEYYDAEIQSGMLYEPPLFFQEVLMENDSLLRLIDAPYSVVSNKLAKFYGIPSKDLRQQPRRFDMPAGSHRGGLLTMAAVLAVSSYPARTSPVLRGKWILESLLGTPPPPPPPNVPELKEHAGETPQTLRARLEQHRANPTCAACHNRIDPLGFGLENYDSLGRWREKDAGQPIDASGVLPDGTKYNGPQELKQVLLGKKTQVVRNLTSKMLGYALGRGLTAEDECAVDQIVAAVERDEYRAHTLIKEIVRSVPFRQESKR
jgi:hypothetical protein